MSAVRAAALDPLTIVTGTRVIRPPDPKLDGKAGLRIARYSSAEAVRILLHCFFRDAHTAIDLTHGGGEFWKPPCPPGLPITTNNIDPEADTDFHVDYMATGFPDAAYGVAIWDPPHLPHLGDRSFMVKKYGTVRSTKRFQAGIEARALEAWRIASIGIIVKLADAPNGGAYLPMTSWATEALGVWPVYVMHTVGRPTPRPRGEVARVPRNNGADWLVFRKDGNRYPDFVRLFKRQQVSRMTTVGSGRRCDICNEALGDRRADAITCSDRCRMARHRARGRAS